MRIMLSNISIINYFFPFFTIILFISHLKINYSNTPQFCSLLNNCLFCKMCGNESNTLCDCEWDPIYESCSKSIVGNIKLDKWYNELSDCEEDDSSPIYCSTKTTYTVDDLEDDKIIININKDNNNRYGKNFIYCYYEFIDEDKQYSYDININYSSNIFLKPKIIFVYYIDERDKNKDNFEEIQDNYEKSFDTLYQFYLLILLKDEYNESPVSIILTRTTNTKVRLIVSFFLTIIFLAVMFSIICCTTRYLNRRTREHLILLRAQRDLEHIQPVVINSEVDTDALKRENTEKLNYLFETKLSEHIYKKEYNQYGGGCSICLENFNKKSKVSITSCNHVFHFKCIHEWLFKNILCPKCPNCNNEILKDYDKNSENNNEINNENGDSSYDDNNEKNTNVTKTIQIKKKDNNKKKNDDISSQNEMLVNGNSLAIGIKNNESPNSKRKMLNPKSNKKKK